MSLKPQDIFNAILAIVLFFALAILFFACSSPDSFPKQTGYASFYADKYHGKRTANGDIFDQNLMTAAHLTLPFNTMVLVHRTDIENGKTVLVRINDRGPYVDGRIIDLSKRAAKRLDMIKVGFCDVEIMVIPNLVEDFKVEHRPIGLLEKAGPIIRSLTPLP